MSKVKTLLLGIMIGCMIWIGVAFAQEQLQITVNVSDVSYVLDGQPLSDRVDELDNDLPPALEFRGMLYAPLPVLAEASGRKWEWDEQEQAVHFTSPTVIEFSELTVEQAPAPVMTWTKQRLEEQGAEHRISDGDTYILITRGMKNTGGYDVSIEHIEQMDDRLIVYADWSDPQKGDLVTQGITYPYVLVKVNGEFDQIEFFHRNPSNIPQD